MSTRQEFILQLAWKIQFLFTNLLGGFVWYYFQVLPFL